MTCSQDIAVRRATSYGYHVEFVIVVTHPERRGPTYSPVPAGHRQYDRWFYESQGAAVRMFESMLRGDWDFSSEYMAKVRVVRLFLDRSPTTVRRWVERPVPSKAQ